MNRTILRRFPAALALVLGLVLSANATAQGRPAPRATDLTILLGEFNFGHGDPSALYGLEVRSQVGGRYGFHGAAVTWRPTVGAFGTSKSALMGYGGMRLQLAWTNGWEVTPGFDIGLYSAGDDIDLGYALEFRSSLEIVRRIGSRNSLGLSFNHISNGSLSDVNPGSNSLTLVFSHRLGRNAAAGSAP